MKVSALTYLADSEAYFESLASLPGAVWLDSGKPGSEEGRFDIITALPDKICTQTDIPSLIDELQAELNRNPEPSHLPFIGGWVGFLGYELTDASLHLPGKLGYPCGKLWFGWYNWALIQDHQLQQCHLLFTDACAEPTEQTIRETLEFGKRAAQSFHCGPFQFDESKANYLARIAKIKEYILAGDCYQANYTQRFSAAFQGAPFNAYSALRKATPNPFCAYLHLPNGSHILSLSQERFINIHQRNALTSPIKGTSARGQNPEADIAQSKELQASVKNQAENLMIVDLLRNDFSKNCALHTVKTPELFQLKSYANVHHLVSSVTGTLRPEVSHPQFILDCFPGGSITGAPKKRAMEIITELEAHARGPYCGALGYFSRNGNTEFNISIRTFLQYANTIHCWAGGGIVADSNPESEYQESIQKVKVLLSTLSELSEH